MSLRSSAIPINLTRYRSPRTVIARFVARRTLRSATLWAFIFGVFTASKTLVYAKVAPTALDRAKLAHTFASNVGLNAMLGVPHSITTVAGYAAWNTFSVVTIIGSIWALMLATKYFRGEEESGRSELLLAGQTTARRGALNTLAGLSVSLCLQFALVAIIYVAIGKSPAVGFSPQSSLFFALSVVMGATLFMAVGALTSQLMPTRGRAVSLAATIFGVFFLVRAMADVTSARWLLDVTPLGWIENLRPLTGSHPIWLLPIIGLVLVCAGLAVYLAGRRDLGESIFADHGTTRSHTILLNSTMGAALRLTRGATIGWLVAIGLAGIFYGLLTKTVAQAISGFSRGATPGKVLGGLVHHAQLSGEKLFLGIVFFLLTALIMGYAASAVGKIRDEEAQGYLDNFLVRPVGRIRWLGERVLLVLLISIIACLLSSAAVWLGEASQHGGVAFHSLASAGLNMLGAVVFTIGAGVVTMGLVPRLTTLVAYSVIGWSFLLNILGSGLNLNHWLIDTSVFQHVTLAPAVAPHWASDAILAGIGAVLIAVGMAVFGRRDLQTE